MNNTHSSPLQRAGDIYTQAIDRYIAHPDDPPELQVRKRLVVGGTVIVLPATILWGGLYIVYGEFWAGFITLAYMLLSVTGLIHLRRAGRIEPLATIQIVCPLLLPFLLTLVLGGIVGSSAIILAAFMSPIGKLMYASTPNSRRWFAGFIILLTLAAVLDPWVRRENGLPQWFILTFFVLNITILSAVIFFMIRTYILQRDRATYLLRQEQDKSEQLLLNVLPVSIAAILKEEKRTIAERFEMVTILFADLVDFTPLSETLDPVRMMDVLNDAFSYFDTVVQKYGLEKVRTMGDNYMVVSGAPERRPDHAQALARAALEIRDFQERITIPETRKLQFRLGMNSGPAIAGVIGQTKFHYDLWGDTVNVASRMESHGRPGMIQITEALYELLRENFICEPRGQIEIKGKGPMNTWWLIREK